MNNKDRSIRILKILDTFKQAGQVNNKCPVCGEPTINHIWLNNQTLLSYYKEVA